MLNTTIAFILAAAPLAAATSAAPAQKAEQHKHREITGEQLKAWIDQKKAMTILDARSKPYFDGTLLPNAKWVSAESSEKDIVAAVPAKDSLVVVYCASPQCPASGWLYDKMTKLGYTNIYEYHEGLKDWMSKGYPTTKQK